MYRIRFHGRGGQGMKTASRILGTAFFLEGFEVQDAPRYGAERRGAPIFAYVRADRHPIRERGVIQRPDLVIVADDSLVPVPGAGVISGLDDHGILLINSEESADTWRHRLSIGSPILTVPDHSGDPAGQRFLGASCAGAAARLVGVISREHLIQAIGDEISALGTAAATASLVQANSDRALDAYEAMAAHAGCVSEGSGISAADYRSPDWVDLPSDPATVAAPAIHAGATSVEVRTGLWRTLRPVIDYSRCNHCWWVCSTFCPDGAIDVAADGEPRIDYDHCKGCMVCVAQCPPHAIEAISEQQAQRQETQAADRENSV